MADHTRRPPAPIDVRSMNTPAPGWSLEQAQDLLAQGYSPAHVQSVTGYDARHLQATGRRRDPAPQRP